MLPNVSEILYGFLSFAVKKVEINETYFFKGGFTMTSLMAKIGNVWLCKLSRV